MKASAQFSETMQKVDYDVMAMRQLSNRKITRQNTDVTIMWSYDLCLWWQALFSHFLNKFVQYKWVDTARREREKWAIEENNELLE